MARVNGRLFLNNVSLGLYARMVHGEDGGDTFAQLKALGLLVRHPGGLGVTVDGRNVDARVVVVSNNRYNLEPSRSGSASGSTRARSTSTSRTAGCPEPGRSAQARRSRSTPERDRCARPIDGEPEQLETPLRFEIEPAALRVLLPEHG